MPAVPRREQNGASAWAAYWQAREADHRGFGRAGRRDLELPRRGSDGSANFGPAYRAGRGEWDDLGRLLDEHWARGWSNEFLSPLYGCKIYTAAALGALLGGGRDAWMRLHRLTAVWSLVATVGSSRRKVRVDWAGVREDIPVLVRSGVLIPTTGCRANYGAAAGNLMDGVLARALGIKQRWWRGEPPFEPPESVAEWRGGGNQPWTSIATIRAAEARTERRLRDVAFNRLCADAVRGDAAAQGLVHEALAPLLVLPRRCTRLVVDRRDNDVMAALDGYLWTRQKLSVPACRIVRGAVTPLVVATRRIPTTQTTASVGPRDVQASADTTGSLPRLRGARTFEFAAPTP